MKKKPIKKRISGNKTKKSSSNNSRTTNIKKRINSKELKKNNNISFIILLASIILVVSCSMIMNIYVGVFVALIIAVVLGLIKLLFSIKGKGKKKMILRLLILLVLAGGVLALLSISIFLIFIKVQADPMFVSTKLDTPENTTLLDINGTEYAKLGAEMREKVSYDELPEVLVDAIIATEDSRFFQHNGFDAPRFIKASAKQALGNSDAGGASTLSMQVVKNSLTNAKATSGVKGIIRKFEDIYLAVFKLEKNYTKEQIIEYYVNNHYLGGNVYGVEEASETYFNKSVSELNLSEAAILAGMFKSPSAYRPTDHPENATRRRKTVLYQMRRHGYITKEEEKLANSIPVETLVYDNGSSVNSAFQGYIDTVVAEIKEKYEVNAYTTPLLVYTNLDPNRQYAVNSVLNGENYEWINDRVQTGVAVLESETGKILAIGNGRNINGRSENGINQYNYATKIKRQPGSTAKPLFDYGPGIEYNDWSTYTLFDDAPYSYSNGRSIKNWDGGYYGTITLRRALSASRNIPALKAFQQVDNSKIIDFVTSLGINPEIENGRIHEAHSIGAFTGVSPLQMAGAYAAFSNGGYYNEPYSVSKIVFKSTNETKEHKSEKKQVMSDATAFMISSVLQDVALNGGTPHNLACKTGTTNFDSKTMDDYNMPGDAIRDSWVVGYSTKTVIGMWYGYDGFTKESIAEGYVLHNIPATIQKDRLFKALVSAGAMEADRADFVQPSSVVKVGIVSGTNPPKKASGDSGNVVYEYFKKDAAENLESYVEEKLATPGNLKVSYDSSTKKVSLSWSGVDKLSSDKNYGTFGYNIYCGSTLIAFTEKTSYSFVPKSSPYDTYRVVAVYKGYSGAQSDPATYTLKEDKTIYPNNLKLTYTGPTVVPSGGALTISGNNMKVTYNSSSVSATVTGCTPNQISTAGKQIIVCNVTYENETYTLNTTITTTVEESGETDSET